ncbi:hypothetical protein JCM10213_004003 [Rhodosporidiobolus nylandii]
MLGSPQSTTTALPTFAFLEEGASSRPDDADFLPAWSRAMPLSPRAAATPLTTGGQAGGLELFSAESFLSVEPSTLEMQAAKLGADTAMSPDLDATGMSISPLPLDPGEGSGSLRGIMSTGGGAFDSAFKQFQSSPSADQAAPRLSPSARAPALDSPAPLSFANVASLASPSSDARMAGTLEASNSAPTPRISVPSPAGGSPKVGLGAAPFAQGLPSGLQRRATDGTGPVEQDDTRIQAYAKLEFPSFDIYIQKLSVTIGRRPASAAPPPPALDTSQLADYILGLSAPQITEEKTLALFNLAPQPTSKGKENAVDESLADFLRISPPPAPPVVAPAHISHPTPLFPSASASAALPPVPSTSAASTQSATAPTTPVEPSPPVTDVDLGPIRAVSRQHAKLYFDYDAGSWAIEVLGRNGVVVEGKWRAKGQRVALVKKTKIQIAERIFYFVLPSIEVVEGEGSPGKKAKAKAQVRGTGKGKGKGKATKRRGGNGHGSSSLSEASGSDVELSPGLAQSGPASKAGSTALVPEPPASVAVPLLPPLPAFAHATSASPSTTRSPSLSIAPSPGPAPSPDILALSSNVPLTRGALKPKPPPPAPKTQRPPPLPEPDVPDELALELGRQRAAVIHQILTGQMSAASGRSALVKAAAAAATEQRRSGGKGMGGGQPAPGKGLGKGKGLPARPRRPSHDAWLDEDDAEDQEDDDESSSSSSDDSDDSAMDVDDLLTGGKFLRKTPAKTPVSAQPTPAASPAPSVAPSSAPPTLAAPSPVSAASSLASTAPPQSQQPFVAKKAPAKQPKQRQNSTGAAAGAPHKQLARNASLPGAVASPLGAALPALPALPSLLPTLPTLPALGAPASPLPSTSSPALSAASATRKAPSPHLPSASPLSLPSTSGLPSLPPATKPSPAPSAVALPSPASVASVPPVASTIQLPGKKPKAPKAPTAGVVAAASPSVAGSPAGSAAPLPGAAKAPRPPPYTPAALPVGAIPPDAAPAADPLAKPPYTYASLIAQAIQSSEQKKMTLHGVYEWILAKWPYFRENQAGWQSSVRHNLTPARGFLKIPRRDDEPGKGSFWQLDPQQLANFDGHHFRVTKPASPAPGSAPALAAAPSAARVGGSPAKPSPSPAPGPGAVGGGSNTASNPALAKPLPIVVAPIPESYVRPAPAPSASSSAAAEGTEDLAATLVKDPPIVLHEGQLLLNPAIFAHLPQSEIDRLQKLPAAQALQILQAEVVSHFKEKMRRAQQERARKEGKGGKGKHKNPGSKAASASPAPSASPVPAPAPLGKPGAPPSALPPAPSTAPTGMKRGREPDIDLTASTTSGKAPPAKVARTAAGGKKR